MKARKRKEAPDWFGCGKVITQESWDRFLAAHKAYWAEQDKRAITAQDAPKASFPVPAIKTAPRRRAGAAKAIPVALVAALSTGSARLETMDAQARRNLVSCLICRTRANTKND